MGAHKSGLERTRSMNLYKFEKWLAIGSEKGMVDGTTIVDSGLGTEISQ